MSSRQLKKLLKNNDPTPLNPPESDSDEDYELNRKANAFAFLQQDENSENDQLQESEQESIPKPIPSSKKKKQQKKKTKASSPLPQDEDLDIVLQEINEKFGHEVAIVSEKSTNSTISSTLSIDSRMLDDEAELKRMFGRAVQENRRSTGRRRGLLTHAKSEWPRMEKLGVDMELISSDPFLVFSFTHSNKYREVEEQMMGAASRFNPDEIAALLHLYPYHLNTLLTMSEILKASGDIQRAGDFVERALYASERSLHARFSLGNSRLSYKKYENRNFFISLFRHIQYLARKACWRTAFEFAKFLYSLEPEEDPMGMALVLDFFANKAEEYEWLLKFLDEYPSLSSFPNMMYGKALALFHLGRLEEAVSCLYEAISSFPNIVPRLFEAAGTSHSKLPALSMEEVETDTVLYDLIVEKNQILWKEADVIQWLRECLTDYKVESIVSKSLPPMTLNFWRHVALCDVDRLSSRVPGYLTRGTLWQHDPLPPPDGESYVQSRTMEIGDMNMLEALFRSILPSFGQPEIVRSDGDHAGMQERAQWLLEQLRGFARGQGQEYSDEEQDSN